MGRNFSLGGPEIQIIYNLKHPLLISFNHFKSIFLGYAISTPTIPYLHIGRRSFDMSLTAFSMCYIVLPSRPAKPPNEWTFTLVSEVTDVYDQKVGTAQGCVPLQIYWPE